MAFDATAKPVGQVFNYTTTISTAENVFYTLLLDINTARNFADIANQFCNAVQISNLLFALNDPNISAAYQQKIIMALNNIATPFNSQVYPILTL